MRLLDTCWEAVETALDKLAADKIAFHFSPFSNQVHFKPLDLTLDATAGLLTSPGKYAHTHTPPFFCLFLEYLV